MWMQFFFAGQSQQTNKNLREVRVRQNLQRAQTEIEDLEIRIRKLTAVTEGLWEILKVELDLEDNVLQAIIDRQDNKGENLGNLVIDRLLKCPKCQRSLSKKKGNCVYCGNVAA